MIKSFEQYTGGCKCGGNCQCNKATNEAKKYKFKDLAKAWQHVYGEDVADEYDGFFNSLKENLEEAETLDNFNSIDEGKYEDMLADGDGHVHFIVGDEAAAERLADTIEAKDLGDCDFYPEDGKIYLRVSFSVGYGGKEVANLKKVEKLVGMKAKAGSPEVWAADESLEEAERKFKRGDKIEYKQLVGMGSKQDWSTLTGVVMKVKNKRKSPLGTLAPHQELTLKSGAVVSPFKNHKDIKLIDEANADGTISPDEDDLRDKLLLETELAITEFLDALKEKSYEIGGKFRGPGILAENMKIVQDKVKRFK